MDAIRSSHLHRRRRSFTLLAIAGSLALLAAAKPADPQGPAITGVAVPKSTWMTMTVAVSYDHPGGGPHDTLTLGARWRRMNGERLDFTPVTARIAPGQGEVILDTKYHGVLPPPTPIILHLELTAPDGRRLAQRNCRMTLVTPQGKEAWAADLMHKKSRDLSWKVKECT
jgi:hypothetical protein